MEENKFCPHCGASIEEGASFCTKCGAKLDGGNQTYSGTYESSSQQSNYDFTNNSGNFQENKPSGAISEQNTYTTLTLVFGILAVVLGGVLWGILGLCFSAKADKNDSKTKVGKVLSIIGIVFWVFMIVLLIVIGVVSASKGATPVK
jgi:heme/copper-type cytochrome/quinol oxidase subunit 2